MDPYEKAASETLRALRGRRSQITFARRLGYRSNPITDWENGRRFPTASEALRAAHLVRVPLERALGAFAKVPAPLIADGFAVHAWLSALRGSTSIVDLASRAQRSRYQVARWLSGRTEPRLPDFLRLVAAITGRVHDLVHELVGIQHVPSLQLEFQRAETARDLALERPWSEAVLRILETQEYLSSCEPSEEFVSARVNLPVEEVRDLLERLLLAQVVEKTGSKLHVLGNLTVDTSKQPERLSNLRSHWARVALSRLESREKQDWFAYNVMTVSRADSQRIEQRLRAAYREVRSIAAESNPGEVASLLTLHMIRW